MYDIFQLLLPVSNPHVATTSEFKQTKTLEIVERNSMQLEEYRQMAKYILAYEKLMHNNERR